MKLITKTIIAFLLFPIFASCVTTAENSESNSTDKEPSYFKNSPYQSDFKKTDSFVKKSEEYPYPRSNPEKAVIVLFNYSSADSERQVRSQLCFNQQFLGAGLKHSYMIAEVEPGNGYISVLGKTTNVFKTPTLEAGKIYYIKIKSLLGIVNVYDEEKVEFDIYYNKQANEDEFFDYYVIREEFQNMTLNERPLTGMSRSNETWYNIMEYYTSEKENDSDYNNNLEELIGY